MILKTDYPIAADSPDHLDPCGARNDNTLCLAFVERCEHLFARHLTYLDLGCAGGGLVGQFAERRHGAVGLEGSDYPRLNGLGAWPELDGTHLFTCDISRPFTIQNRRMGGWRVHQFEIISAWEVLEHIPEERLPQLLSNIKGHLAAGGYFVASIGIVADPYHQTVKSPAWWRALFTGQGWREVPGVFQKEEHARGIRNTSCGGSDYDVDAERDPCGFHITLQPL